MSKAKLLSLQPYSPATLHHMGGVPVRSEWTGLHMRAYRRPDELQQSRRPLRLGIWPLWYECQVAVLGGPQ